MFRHLAHLDITTSTMIVEAVLQALLARERMGKGQHVEIDMVSAALSLQTSRLAEYFATGTQPLPMGSAASTTVPHQAFLCEDGEYMAVGVEREEQWPRFCRAIGRSDLSQMLEYADNVSRVENRADLIELLEKIFRTKPVAWWELRLTRERVPNTRVARTLDFQSFRRDPQITENGLLQDVMTPHWGTLCVDAVPWQFEKTPAGPIRPGGLKGEHTDAVLKEFGIVE